MDIPANERQVEVPFLLGHVEGNKVLDVGRDRDDLYIPTLRARGIIVETCDPWDMRADYQMEFIEMQDKYYDCILMISSLEHFEPTSINRRYCLGDIANIIKCRKMTSRLIITVPFGKEKIYYDAGRPDFIQWDAGRVKFIQWSCGIKPLCELVMRWENVWIPVARDEWGTLSNLEYRENGAQNASAVYCGLWAFT